MFWNREPVVEPVAALEVVSEPVVVPEYGARCGEFTQFGTTWIDLSRVNAIEFRPGEKFGAEIKFCGDSGSWDVPNADAAALENYLRERGSRDDVGR
jgi:hypothetical protein